MASLLKPLFELTKKSIADFQWLSVDNTAFEHMKLSITSETCLADFDDRAELELYCDSSECALSAMLSHKSWQTQR